MGDGPIDESFVSAVRQEYVESVDRLTVQECVQIKNPAGKRIPASTCDVIVDVFGFGSDAQLSMEKGRRLIGAGCSAGFNRGMYGAVNARALWLASQLDNNSYYVGIRKAMVWELGEMGIHASEALPTLKKLVEKNSRDLGIDREELEWAIRKIEGENVDGDEKGLIITAQNFATVKTAMSQLTPSATKAGQNDEAWEALAKTFTLKVGWSEYSFSGGSLYRMWIHVNNFPAWNDGIRWKFSYREVRHN